MAAGVVVTGAAQGIGAAIAAACARQGDLVVGVDLDDARLASTMAGLEGAGHQAVVGDAADEDIVRSACRLAMEEAGTLRCYVANAGRALPGASVDVPLDDWNALINVNLTAGFLGARVARTMMTEGASIVFISSINASLGFGARAAYSAAKAGVEGLVRSLAVEWAPAGVRVNAVAPGAVATEMQARFRATGYADLDAYTSRIPMGRFARPDEVAEAVRWLGSSAASFTTGVVLPVDGGWSVHGLP